ncbi:MAG: hypothetical protein AB1352_00385 [Patescibacteria group bacterium]
MSTTTLSQKYQTVVPMPVRRKMGLRAGMKVTWYPIDENRTVVVKHPTNYVKAMEGLGAEVWQTLGGTDKYIRQERDSWEK